MKKLSVCFILFCSYFVGISQTHDIEEFSELIQEFPIGNSVYAQEQYEIQLTSGFNFFNFNSLNTFSPNLTLEYGFTDRFQIEIGTTYEILSPINGEKIKGFGNSEIGVLYNIINKKKWALSVSFELELPTSTKKFGEQEMQYEPSIIGAIQIGRIQIHSSFGIGLSDDYPEFDYNISAILPLKKFRPMLEINSLFANEINEPVGTELYKNIFLTPGIGWIPNENVEFSIGAPIQITKNEPKWGIVFKFIFEFNLKNED